MFDQFLTMRFFLSMFKKNLKHRANDASNDVIAHPYPALQDQLLVTTCSQTAKLNCRCRDTLLNCRPSLHSKYCGRHTMDCSVWTHGGVFASRRGEMTLKTARWTLWLKITSERHSCLFERYISGISQQ